MCVGSQPYVILTDEQFQTDLAEPSKKAGISSSKECQDISQQDVGNYLQIN